MPNVTIVSTPAYHCAAIDHLGPYHQIGAAFDRLAAWARPRGLMGLGSHCFGIYYDDPNTVPSAKLRSAACLTIGPEVTIEPPLRPVHIPGGRHARLQHKGPYAELEQVYRYLYRTWLPASGEQPADAPCFEAYLNDCKSLPPSEWLTDVYLPLAPKSGTG
jgi:AraC family transcriptional regulator